MKELRRIFGYMRPYLARLIVAATFLALAGALMSAALAVLKPLADQVLNPEAARAASTGAEAAEGLDLLETTKRALGFDRKLELRRTAVPTMRVLRAAKGVRVTLADPFRWAEVRRVERAMIPEYVAAVERLAAGLDLGGLGDAVEIASLPDQVRGYEHLKLRRAAAYRSELARRTGSKMAR